MFTSQDKILMQQIQVHSSLIQGVGNTTVIASNDDMRHYYSVFSLCIQFLLPFTGMGKDSTR